MTRQSNLPKQHESWLRCALPAMAGAVLVAVGCFVALYPAFSRMVDVWLVGRGDLVLRNVLSDLKALPLVLQGLALLAAGAALIVRSCLTTSRTIGSKRLLVLTIGILLVCANILVVVGFFLM